MQISGAWRLTGRVFLPFALGYYLSYLFRTINALIASHLSSDTLLAPQLIRADSASSFSWAWLSFCGRGLA
ncbi:hypothetical protein FNJ47_47680, partial [Bradyrhizobium sp. UFLA 03-164]|nr:hypothetical protein [Bradyrhizobium uaiense]